MTQSTHFDDVAAPVPGRRIMWINVGGALGIAACFIGLAIFLVACAGFHRVFAFSLIPLGLSVVGLAMVIIDGFRHRELGVEATGALAALFVNLMGIFGALVMMAVWLDWPIFYRGAAGM